jgi:hypothetical protein
MDLPVLWDLPRIDLDGFILGYDISNKVSFSDVERYGVQLAHSWVAETVDGSFGINKRSRGTVGSRFQAGAARLCGTRHGKHRCWLSTIASIVKLPD